MQDNVPYALGIDIGIASVGAALVADDHIVGLHVRIFDKAEVAKTGESLNSKRREARLTRRRLKRRRSRLLRLRKLMVEYGLLSDWKVKDCNGPLSENVTGSPWQLRAEGLDRELSPSEWATVLYHLINHRGFQSNRKSETAPASDDGKMVASATGNQSKFREKGYRTIGEMIALDPDFAEKKRNSTGDYSHTLLRKDIEEELRELFRIQRSKNNNYAGELFEEKVHALLMERKPALSGKDLLKMVGQCTFETDEYRAPKSLPSSERFVWLSKLNNLHILSFHGERSLSQEQKTILDRTIQEKGALKYSDIRRLLNLKAEDFFSGIRYSTPFSRKKNQSEETGEKTKEQDPEDQFFYEFKHFIQLKKAYKKAGRDDLWSRDSKDPDRLDAISEALTIFKEDDEIQTHLSGLGIEKDIIDAVLPLSFSGFIRLSRKSVLKILPHLEAGYRYDEAVRMAGYQHHSVRNTASCQKFLPPIDPYEIRNPVVFRALNQARKLINAIIRQYGSPRSVHIELARDLNKTLQERRAIEDEQKKNQELRNDDFNLFDELFKRAPKKDEFQKLRFYREQDGKCAYCLEAIDIRRLLEEGYAEIDHALPYSRSFDDSLSNKVLVHIKENQEKGDSTPFEYLGGGTTERWKRYRDFVESNKKYGRSKRSKLLREQLDPNETEEFLERNLSDTRFIARFFKNLVESSLLLDGGQGSKRCVVVSGQMTAYLRRHWGLTKNREESDLHHAMDAAVVAVTSHSMVKRLSDWSRQRECRYLKKDEKKEKPKFPMPYDSFIEELKAKFKDVRVSRASRRLGTGQVHEETIRSAKFASEGKTWKKVPLKELTTEMLDKIVGYTDPRNTSLIEGLRKRLSDHGGDPKKAFSEPFFKPSSGSKAPIVRSVKVYTDLKSGIPVRGGIAERGPGSMIRVDIFTDGKKFYPVPIYISDIGKKQLPNKAVVAHRDENEWTEMTDAYKFLFSLHPNDWIRVESKEKVFEGYFRKFDRAAGTINIAYHDMNINIGKDGLYRVGIKTAKGLSKFHVDLLGGLHLVRKEFRQPLQRKF